MPFWGRFIHFLQRVELTWVQECSNPRHDFGGDAWVLAMSCVDLGAGGLPPSMHFLGQRMHFLQWVALTRVQERGSDLGASVVQLLMPFWG